MSPHLDSRHNPTSTTEIKIAISIPDNVFEGAEELTRRLEMSRSELYTRTVEAYVRSHRDEAVTDALNKVYATEDESVDPMTEQLQYCFVALTPLNLPSGEHK